MKIMESFDASWPILPSWLRLRLLVWRRGAIVYAIKWRYDFFSLLVNESEGKHQEKRSEFLQGRSKLAKESIANFLQQIHMQYLVSVPTTLATKVAGAVRVRNCSMRGGHPGEADSTR